MIDFIQLWYGVGFYVEYIIFLILILNLNVEILCGENLCLNNSICFFMFNIVFCCCIKGMFKVYCFLIGKIIFIGIIYYNLLLIFVKFVLQRLFKFVDFNDNLRIFLSIIFNIIISIEFNIQRFIENELKIYFKINIVIQ